MQRTSLLAVVLTLLLLTPVGPARAQTLGPGCCFEVLEGLLLCSTWETWSCEAIDQKILCVYRFECWGPSARFLHCTMSDRDAFNCEEAGNTFVICAGAEHLGDWACHHILLNPAE